MKNPLLSACLKFTNLISLANVLVLPMIKLLFFIVASMGFVLDLS